MVFFVSLIGFAWYSCEPIYFYAWIHFLYLANKEDPVIITIWWCYLKKTTNFMTSKGKTRKHRITLHPLIPIKTMDTFYVCPWILFHFYKTERKISQDSWRYRKKTTISWLSNFQPWHEISKTFFFLCWTISDVFIYQIKHGEFSYLGFIVKESRFVTKTFPWTWLKKLFLILS